MSRSAGIWAAVLAIVLACPAARAQEDCGPRAEAVSATYQTPVSAWTDSFVQSNFQNLLELYLCQLWHEPLHSKIKAHLPDQRPQVQLEVAGALRTPYISDRRIVFPVEFLWYLTSVASVVGHDVYRSINQEGSIFNRPLLTTPYRRGAVFESIYPLQSLADGSNFAAMKMYLDCPTNSKSCAFILEQSLDSIISFALLHESSHLALHHVLTTEGTNVDQETAADRNAFIVLREVSELRNAHFKPDTRETISQAAYAPPLAWLEVESAREGIANVVAKARLEALSAWVEKGMEPEQKLEFEDLYQPEKESHAMLGLEISGPTMPERLLIDGVSVDPKAVIGKRILLTNNRHVILAAAQGELAIGRTDRAYGHRDIQFPLTFRSPAVADTAAVPAALERRDWLAVLAGTSDANLQPRSPELAVAHWRALHGLKLDAWVKPNQWNGIPADDWKALLRYQQQGQPLSSWY